MSFPSPATARWTQDHLIRITACIAPSSADASEAVDQALAAWFTACTADPEATLPHSHAALSGGSALERHRAGDAHVVVIISGGEDGLDSVEAEVAHLRVLIAATDPSGLLTVARQWRHEDEPAWSIAAEH